MGVHGCGRCGWVCVGVGGVSGCGGCEWVWWVGVGVCAWVWVGVSGCGTQFLPKCRSNAKYIIITCNY